MRSTQERRCGSNRGFTLVEMIVTMMLLSILLTISVMGLLAWQDWSDFNQANEYAETMFLSAQNQLSEYNANGTLEDFAKQTKNYSPAGVKLDSIYYEEGKAYTEDSVWVTKDKGTLVSVCANKGDYSLYAAGEVTTSPTAPIVYQLLESYLYDTSILNDAICVEFSLEDGQVFSVLYCGKANDDDEESFVYSGSDDNLRGQVNISSRYESYRKDRMLGYYGVDTLSKAMTSEKVKPKLKVALHNEETLNLSIQVEKPANAATNLNYDITIYDVDTDFCSAETMPDGVPVLQFTLKGQDIKNEQTVKEMIKSGKFDQVPKYEITRNVKKNGTWESQNLGKFSVLSWSEKDGTIRVLLDAADLQAASRSYEKNLSVLKDNTKADEIKKDTFTFKTTYSFRRFGVDASQIKCSVQASGAMYETSVKAESNTSYVYFENESHNSDNKNVLNYNYSIANARHLYNMRYITDLTANTKKGTDELLLSNAHYKQKTEDQDKTIRCHFQLTKDIDWSQFVEDGWYFNTGKNGIHVDGEGITKEETQKLASAFVSMRQLRAEDSFTGGNDDAEEVHTIKGLSMLQSANALSMIYPDTDAADAEQSGTGQSGTNAGNKTEEDAKKPVGLFATNYGSIKNLKLEGVQVESPGDYVGTFAGITVCGMDTDNEATGVLKNLEVVCKNPNDEKASYVKGSSYVGGIVGKLEGTEADGKATNVEWSKLVNAAKVTGKSYVGGIVGELRTDAARKSSITLSECENSGAVYAVLKQSDMADAAKKAECKFIGGIVGSCVNAYAANHTEDTSALANITIKDSNSTPYYSKDDLKEFLGDQNNGSAFQTYADKVIGTYVGGITGYSYFSTLEGVRAEQDDPGKQSYVFGHDYVGGIVGYATGSAAFSGKYKSKTVSRNDNYVIGCSYVGGVIGANADVDLAKTKEAAGSNSNNILVLVEDGSSPIVASDTVNPKNNVSNWQNTGVVYAIGTYAGGISGYNTGALIENSDASGETTVAGTYPVSYAADYVGGITGYNHGVIKAEARKDNNVRIVGKNYVGGIVGYNDSDAEVTNYAVKAGSINGDPDKGSYVGGLVGCNASIAMLQNADGSSKQLYVSTQDISGKYFVGGVIGANIINTNGYNQNMITEPGQSGSSDVATDSSAGQTSKLCYVKLARTDMGYGNGKVYMNYTYTIINDSDKALYNWSLKFHFAKGTIVTNNYGPGTRSVEETDKETLEIFEAYKTSEENINYNYAVRPHGTTADIALRITFPSYEAAYSFDVTDIELFYSGGDGNTVVTKPGNLAITKKNRHEIGMNDAVYQFQYDTTWYDFWDGTKTVRKFKVNGFKINNISEYDIFDWAIDVPIIDDTLTIRSDWTALKYEIIEKDINGVKQKYLHITPNSSSNLYTYIPKKTALNYGGTVTFGFEMDSDEKFKQMSENTRVIFYTSELVQQTEDIQYARIQTTADMANFSGTITGSAFTGGYIGYTMLVNSTDTTYARTTAENVRKLTLNQASEAAVIKAVCDAKFDTSEVQIYVTGTVGGGSVTADTYVGGLVGYDDANTFLRIENAKNRASVTAKTGYAGGMISASRKSNNKILTSNNYGTITAKEVAGGIVGENKGTVNQCNVSATIVGNRGTSIASYGGIVGVSGIAAEKAEDVDAAQVMECTFTGNISGAGDGVTANVGGIVGANGYNSTVKASTIGSQDTVVHGGMAGTATYNMATTNVGGIVGTNYGTVSSTDNSQKANGNTTIDNYFGYTGGIVGCNKKDAIVKGTDTEQIITAGTWHVIAKAAGENTAVGGIIGHSMSKENLEYLMNHAEVKTTATGNIAVGGIVGQMENQTSDAMTFTKCYNYGAVTGTWYTGGIIGYLRHKGVTLESCSNDGTVEGGTGQVGEMIGYADAGISDIHCNNCTVKGNSYTYSAQLASDSSEDSQVVADVPVDEIEDTTQAEQSVASRDADSTKNADTEKAASSTEQQPKKAEVLEAPDTGLLAADKRNLMYYDGQQWSLEQPADDETLIGTYESRAYQFDVQDGADYYEVQIKDASGAYGMLYVEPKKEKYYVYYAGTNASVRRESICDENPYTEFSGILTEENPVDLSYAVTVRLPDVVTDVCAKVRVKGTRISVLLPDTTTFISVQAVVGEAHADTYISSDAAVWKLVPAEEATTTDADTITVAEDADMVIWTGIVKKQPNETELPKLAGTQVVVGSGSTSGEVINYTVGIDKPMLVQILGYDTEGNLNQSVYYTADETTASFMLEKDVWFTDDETVKIRFAAMDENGLADWTEPVKLTESGIKN